MTKQICGPSGRGPRILHPTRLYKRKERRNREGTNKIGRSKGGIEFKMDEGYSKLIIMCLYHHYILYCVYSSSVKTTIQVSTPLEVPKLIPSRTRVCISNIAVPFEFLL